MTARVTQRLRAAADDNAPAISELIAGDSVEIFEIADHRAWGRSLADGAVGYLDAEGLTIEHAPTTHLIASVAADLKAAPEATAPSLGRLPMGARLSAGETVDGFLSTAAGFVSADNAVPLDRLAGKPIDWAEKLVGVPHVPGGRSGFGVNCSGLVFLAHQMAGIVVPRFADLQARQIGAALDDPHKLMRGDLIFFEDHALFMADSQTALHAVEGESVLREPLTEIIEAGRYGPAIAFRRAA